MNHIHLLLIASFIVGCRALTSPKCKDLNPMQYDCVSPPMDPSTHELTGCTVTGVVNSTCTVIDGVNCTGSRVFTLPVKCRWTNGIVWRSAMGISVFLGVFGIDRCYLGYPTMGIFKLITIGGFGVMYFVDVILVATQNVLPADGSGYVLDAYAPRYEKTVLSSETQ